MKLVVLCVIFMAATTYAERFEGSPEAEEIFREDYCNDSVKRECASYRCNKDNSKIIAIPCPVVRCSGKVVGYRGDPNKPYPECCMVPICEDPSR